MSWTCRHGRGMMREAPRRDGAMEHFIYNPLIVIIGVMRKDVRATICGNCRYFSSERSPWHCDAGDAAEGRLSIKVREDSGSAESFDEGAVLRDGHLDRVGFSVVS